MYGRDIHAVRYMRLDRCYVPTPYICHPSTTTSSPRFVSCPRRVPLPLRSYSWRAGYDRQTTPYASAQPLRVPSVQSSAARSCMC
jgi:hypothetical protein